MRAALLLVVLLLGSTGGCHQPVRADQLAPGARVWLHAHNCYPEKGRWADRMERALSAGAPHLAIEQDIAWFVDADGEGRSVVSHDLKLTGSEPTLEAHFFDRVRPLMEQALVNDRRETWPVLVLHLDFKSNEPAHHQAVWDLLGRYEPWLTTAERAADDTVTPFRPGPLLVLTESGDGQAEAFHGRIPAGGRLRLFGTVPPAVFPNAQTSQQRAAAVHAAPPDVLVPSGATSYRRWINFPWAAVELGGPNSAADWTPDDDRRLRALVDRAHASGLWVRFYTLNGHEPGAGHGWTESYNFGSEDRVHPRWHAAIAAGVDFIATDQYEDLARLLGN